MIVIVPEGFTINTKGACRRSTYTVGISQAFSRATRHHFNSYVPVGTGFSRLGLRTQLSEPFHFDHVLFTITFLTWRHLE